MPRRFCSGLGVGCEYACGGKEGSGGTAITTCCRNDRLGNGRLTARQRLAAERAGAAGAELAAARRRRMLLGAGVPVLLVVVVVAVLVVVKVAAGAGGPRSGATASAAASSVVAQVTSVPAGVFNGIGVGVASTKPTKITAPALRADGEPRVVGSRLRCVSLRACGPRPRR